MAKDLTDNVRVASGDLHIRTEQVDFSGLMRQVTEDCAALFEDHEIVFHGAPDCDIMGDRDRLERLALNLISNAVKYSPEGSTVRVNVERQNARVALSVGDEGPGIDADDVEVIFQPFGRGKSAGSIAKGAGLGLYVVKQIVEAHGGSIDVESTEGRGTTVRVALPVAQS